MTLHPKTSVPSPPPDGVSSPPPPPIPSPHLTLPIPSMHLYYEEACPNVTVSSHFLPSGSGLPAEKADVVLSAFGNNSSYHGSCKLQALNSNCLTAEVYWTIMSMIKRIHGFPPTSPFLQASSSFAVTITVSPASKDSGKPAHSLFLAFALCLKFTLPPARFSFLPNNNHLTLGQ